MPTIQTSRAEIWFADHRKEDRIPLVLVHGASGSHLDWSKQLRQLGSVALDLPGHGRSSGSGRRHVKEYAEDVISLLDALEISQAVVMGHSMGGAIAQTIALEHPSRLKGMILIGTGAKLRVHPDIVERVKTDYEAVVELLKDWFWGEDAPEAMRELAAEAMLKVDPEVTYHDYKACDEFDIRSELADISTSTLVIGGTQDKMTPFKYSQYLADNLPDAQLVKIEGGGHMMALEYPDLVADHVQQWIATLNAS